MTRALPECDTQEILCGGQQPGRPRLDFELQRLALLDASTGLPSRSYLDLILAEGLRRLGSSEVGFGLLLIEVDGFQSIQALRGSAFADALRGAMARALAAGLRPGDCLACFDDTALAVLVEVPSEAGLMAMGEDLRALVANLALPLAEGGQLAVTASVGGARARRHDSLVSLNARACGALALSRDAGGNLSTLAAGRMARFAGTLATVGTLDSASRSRVAAPMLLPAAPRFTASGAAANA